MTMTDEEQAAVALMQLYLSPVTPLIRPSSLVRAMVPPLDLEKVSASGSVPSSATGNAGAMDVEDSEQKQSRELKTSGFNDLVLAVERGLPKSISGRRLSHSAINQRPPRARKMSLSTASGFRPKSNKLIDSPIEILPRLRSHARRASISTAYVNKKKRGESVDSDVVYSEPDSVGGICQYEGILANEEGEKRIGIYSIEERKKIIQKYLQKRKQRVWQKKIKYKVRKTFADSRLRVKGRFISKEDEASLRDALQFCL